MTNEKAIEMLEYIRQTGNGESEYKNNAQAIAINMAIKALSDRPKGEWIWQLANNGWVDHICSVCGYTENTDIHVSLGWKYCPNCGAEMKGTGNEDN